MEFLPYNDLCRNNKIVDLPSLGAGVFRMVPCSVQQPHSCAPEFVFTFTNLIYSQLKPRSHSFPITNMILYPANRHPVSKVNDNFQFIDRKDDLYLDLAVSAKFSWSGITLSM